MTTIPATVSRPRLRAAGLLWDLLCGVAAIAVLGAMYRTDRDLVTRSVFDDLCFAGSISVLLATAAQLSARVNAFSFAPPVIGLAAAAFAATLDLGLVVNTVIVISAAALIGFGHGRLVRRVAIDIPPTSPATWRGAGPWLVSVQVAIVLFVCIRVMFGRRTSLLVSTEFLNFRWGPQALAAAVAVCLVVGTATVVVLPLSGREPRRVVLGLATSAVLSAISGIVMLYEQGAVFRAVDWGRWLSIAPAVLVGGFSPTGTRGAIVGAGALGAGLAVANRWSDLAGRPPGQFVGALIALWVVGHVVHWLLDRRLDQRLADR